MVTVKKKLQPKPLDLGGDLSEKAYAPQPKKAKPVFILTVKGQYFAQLEKGGKVTKPYTMEVKLPVSMMSRALSIIKHNLLDAVLSKKYDDYGGFRTHTITKTVAPDEVSSRHITFNLMSRDQLISYAQSEGLQFDATRFRKAADLRKAIEDFKDNPTLFLKRYKKLSENMDLVNELTDLNKEIMADE